MSKFKKSNIFVILFSKMICDLATNLKVKGNILKNSSTGILLFKQLGQTELISLERDLQLISWASLFLNWG